MRNIFLFFFTIIVLTLNVGCNAQSPKRNGDTVIANEIDPILFKFGLPYDENLLTDSSSLFFYYLKPFDTSFLVHLRRTDNKVLGTYYSVLPSYHRDVEDYYNEESKLLFFEGFSFKIDIIKWQQIKDRSFQLLKSNSTSSNGSCFDCAYYFLSHNGLKIQENQNNRKLFEDYLLFLKKELINQFNEIRKPKLVKKQD
jgi:hypothetical protein